MVPMDVPAVALDMIRKFISKQSFGSGLARIPMHPVLRDDLDFNGNIPNIGSSRAKESTEIEGATNTGDVDQYMPRAQATTTKGIDNSLVDQFQQPTGNHENWQQITRQRIFESYSVSVEERSSLDPINRMVVSPEVVSCDEESAKEEEVTAGAGAGVDVDVDWSSVCAKNNSLHSTSTSTSDACSLTLVIYLNDDAGTAPGGVVRLSWFDRAMHSEEYRVMLAELLMQDMLASLQTIETNKHLEGELHFKPRLIMASDKVGDSVGFVELSRIFAILENVAISGVNLDEIATNRVFKIDVVSMGRVSSMAVNKGSTNKDVLLPSSTLLSESASLPVPADDKSVSKIETKFVFQGPKLLLQRVVNTLNDQSCRKWSTLRQGIITQHIYSRPIAKVVDPQLVDTAFIPQSVIHNQHSRHKLIDHRRSGRSSSTVAMNTDADADAGIGWPWINRLMPLSETFFGALSSRSNNQQQQQQPSSIAILGFCVVVIVILVLILYFLRKRNSKSIIGKQPTSQTSSSPLNHTMMVRQATAVNAAGVADKNIGARSRGTVRLS